MRRGNELYERIRPQIEKGSRGKIVALDLESGQFEVAADSLVASECLLVRLPDRSCRVRSNRLCRSLLDR